MNSQILPIESMEKSIKRLWRMAKQVRKRAYAPFSKYLVGCAVLDAKGKIHTGCNIESDTFLAAVCAERLALFKMISRGVRECTKVVIVTSFDEPLFPCGICRQVIHEFGKNPIIYSVNRQGTTYREATLAELLPFRYSLHK